MSHTTLDGGGVVDALGALHRAYPRKVAFHVGQMNSEDLHGTKKLVVW